MKCPCCGQQTLSYLLFDEESKNEDAARYRLLRSLTLDQGRLMVLPVSQRSKARSMYAITGAQLDRALDAIKFQKEIDDAKRR